jgi:6-pyruvoyltetrahydropterin/6-carboxytetrahydropterin synthase
MYEVSRTFLLHCSHIATKGDEACRRLHGHTFEITITCSCDQLDADGFAVDFFDFDAAIGEVISTYDHRHLNDLMPHPTCEALAKAVFCSSIDHLPRISSIEVTEIGIGRVKFLPNRT